MPSDWLKQILLCRNHKNQNLIICKEAEGEIIFPYANDIISMKFINDHEFIAQLNESLMIQPYFLINVLNKDCSNIDLLIKHLGTLPIEMVQQLLLYFDPNTDGSIFALHYRAYHSHSPKVKLL